MLGNAELVVGKGVERFPAIGAREWAEGVVQLLHKTGMELAADALIVCTLPKTYSNLFISQVTLLYLLKYQRFISPPYSTSFDDHMTAISL